MINLEWPHILFYVACHVGFVIFMVVLSIKRNCNWRADRIESRITRLEEEARFERNTHSKDLQDLNRKIFDIELRGRKND